MDLPRLLGLRPAAPEPGDEDPYRHIVLMAGGETAFLVDRVADLVRMAPDSVRPVAGDQTLNGCVVGQLVTGGGLVPVLSAARILTAEERGRLASLAAREGERLAALAEA